jgi:C_GCAxxG_C_C family probable redox protein
MLAVGEYYFGSLTKREIALASGFEGGIGGSYQNNCGAFSASIMIIGGLFGYGSENPDDEKCQLLASRFQEEFKSSFDTLICGDLREEKFGSGGAEPCEVLVERVARLLIKMLDSEIKE